MLSQHDCVEEGQLLSGTPMYLVYAHKGSSTLCWSSTCVGIAMRQLRDVSIPNNVRELCDRCFKGCECLCRMTFVSSSSLERLGVSCFEWNGVEEVSIPDCVHELCDCCFKRCELLCCVKFGFSSSLERIGTDCFATCRLFQFEYSIMSE